MKRTHLNNELRKTHVGTEVVLYGWVHRRRDHGGVIFIDLRDRYGLTQIVTDPVKHPEVHQIADQLRSEYVIEVSGIVRERPNGQANKNMETGDIEILIQHLKILNKSEVPPFEIDSESNVNEELRLKYRYLDLRKERMKENIVFRHTVVKSIRDFLDNDNFLEIETPILIKGTPEGSREYLVPSRLFPGEFFVLPQSPQQLKQLLMISGFDKYFQIARCFRDEDQRGDRQPEFTQVDMEMSFVEEEEIMNITEKLLIELSEKHVPQKKLITTPFPRMTWHEAMNKYGSDKPDIRFDFFITDVSEIASKTEFSIFKNAVLNGGVVKCLKIEDGLKFTRKEIDEFIDVAKTYGLKGLAYIQITEDGPKSSLVKFFTEAELKQFIEVTGASAGDILFFAADDFETSCTALGQVRLACADYFNLRDNNILAYVWVTDFPLFEKDKLSGALSSAHHPFTAPKIGQETILKQNPDKTIAQAYDIVLNGYEIGGGSIRIHDQNLQQNIFSLLSISKNEAQKRFGHLLEAFQYGAPPHGGIALGLERLLMIYRDEPNIREVMSFPKDSKAKDLMLGAPSKMPEDTTKELHIKIIQE